MKWAARAAGAKWPLLLDAVSHTPPPPHNTIAPLCYHCSSDDFRTELTWAPEALEALRCAAEDYAVGLMGEACLESIHGNRSIIYPKDLKLAQRCRGERG